MIVEQIYVNNALRNFNYLIVCPETGEACAIDPLAADTCYEIANKKNYNITKIINTHEHWDHIGGNSNLQKLTGAEILAHKNATFEGITKSLSAGDIIAIGKLKLKILDTPGHTFAHICLLALDDDKPAVFSGDTLFNAGIGNCHNGGDASYMYKSVYEQLYTLADATLVYPGHDYLSNNINFTLSLESSNASAQSLQKQLANKHDPYNPKVTTIAEEKQFNTFFRLTSADLIANILKSTPELTKFDNEEQIFVALRKLRDKW